MSHIISSMPDSLKERWSSFVNLTFLIPFLYYFPAGNKKPPSGDPQIPESISSSCDLLRRILSQQLQPSLAKFIQHSSDSYRVGKLRQQILDECHRTFVHCFHAFYPTAQLKWLFLCDLLSALEPVS